MFTVLHRDAYGTETLYQATSVMRIKRHAHAPAAVQSDGPGPGVLMTLVGGDTLHYGEANCRSTDQEIPTVFVMNDAGKTVARYEL